MIIYALPWWAWILCGLGGLSLGTVIGWISEDSGSAVADLIRLTVAFAGIVCIAIGIALLLFGPGTHF